MTGLNLTQHLTDLYGPTVATWASVAIEVVVTGVLTAIGRAIGLFPDESE